MGVSFVLVMHCTLDCWSCLMNQSSRIYIKKNTRCYIESMSMLFLFFIRTVNSVFFLLILHLLWILKLQVVLSLWSSLSDCWLIDYDYAIEWSEKKKNNEPRAHTHNIMLNYNSYIQNMNMRAQKPLPCTTWRIETRTV